MVVQGVDGDPVGRRRSTLSARCLRVKECWSTSYCALRVQRCAVNAEHHARAGHVVKDQADLALLDERLNQLRLAIRETDPRLAIWR